MIWQGVSYVCKMTYSYTDPDAGDAAVSFVAEYTPLYLDLVGEFKLLHIISMP